DAALESERHRAVFPRLLGYALERVGVDVGHRRSHSELDGGDLEDVPHLVNGAYGLGLNAARRGTGLLQIATEGHRVTGRLRRREELLRNRSDAVLKARPERINGVDAAAVALAAAF